MAMDEEIKAEFERSGFSVDEDGQVIQKCVTFCINHKLSPADLVINWDLYYLNRQLSGLRVENAYMDGFLSYLQSELKDKIIKDEPPLHVYSSYDVEMLLDDDHNDMGRSLSDTVGDLQEKPYFTSHNSSSTPRTNEKSSSTRELAVVNDRITPFGQRTNKFVSQFILNTHSMDGGFREKELGIEEDDIIKKVQAREWCSLQIIRSQPEPGCKFMCDRMEDKFLSLESRIRRHSTAFSASGLHGEPSDATIASQISIFAVGMLCCEGEGHLNEKSILLQGSVQHCGGRRVRLDLQKLDHFSLFPGQVVGIEGHNPSGHCLVATKVIDYLPSSYEVDLPPSKKQARDKDDQSNSLLTASGELSLLVAAGPFTTTDNLLFEPLTELLAYARRKQPQLLILIGPYIDSEHPDIRKGTVDRSFDELFNVEIVRRLQDYAEYMGSAARVILIPSTRDASHDFVFPQPAMQIHLPDDINDQITNLANPAFFSANEITLGCCSMDILKQLSSEEISRTRASSSSTDRMGRLATHLLHQRSWYPLYPPSEGVPLDLSLAPEALEIPSAPDVLILPSDLAPFVKVLKLGIEEGHGEHARMPLCVNPGRLAKGIGGGTFAELEYCGGPDTSSAAIIRI